MTWLESEKVKTHVWKIGDTQDEAYRIQDVRLPGAVQASDSVEFGVEACDFHPVAVGLESVQDDRLDKHSATLAKNIVSYFFDRNSRLKQKIRK